MRGRWKHVAATQRYTKTRLLVAKRDYFGEQVIGRGKQIMADPRGEVVKAVLAGPGSNSRNGKAIVGAMQKPWLADSG